MKPRAFMLMGTGSDVGNPWSPPASAALSPSAD